MGWGGQGGCERRTEVFVKIQKKKKFWRGEVGLGGGGVRVDVNQKLKFFRKFKKNWGAGGGVSQGGGVWGGGKVGLGGQDGCERGIEVFVKIKKKNFFFWGGGGGGGSGWGGQGGCEQRIEVFVKIQKKIFFGGGGGGQGRGRVGGSGWM